MKAHKVKLTCEGCGTEFLRSRANYNQSVKRGQKNFYCSQQCRNLVRLGKSQVTFTCLTCSRKVSTLKSSKTKRMYCSIRCKADSQIKVTTCSCGNEVYKRSKYCVECKNSKDVISRYTDTSIGQLRATTSSLLSYHSIVRSHARRVYAKHVNVMSCLVCGYSKFVEICHVKPLKAFKDTDLISDVNSASNLVAMCRNHHWEFDHNALEGVLTYSDGGFRYEKDPQ